MCGIAGVYDQGQPPSQELLERLAAPLRRRGPDSCGYLLRGPLGLVHTRLSIIDLATGDQPMFNEDGTLAIVFNGEIYDYQGLRDRLQAAGHVFRTHSDTEVLLHLYEDLGPEMLPQLNGMFAFAICHLESGDIFFARDRLGKKPLFLAWDGERLGFASGLRSLLALPWVQRDLDPQAIADYLEFQYVPTPSTIYRGVQKLPPGSCAFWRRGRLSVDRYWTPHVSGDYHGSYSEAQAHLRDLLREAVRRRLVADVPVGLFLSGGMDSSIVCALARELAGERVQTFSIGFPEAAYDERRYAQTVARHLDTDHHFLEVQPGDYQHLRSLVGEFEEPFCDSSLLPTSLLARFTRQHVTVALSGDAADELFGGYYRYRVMRLYDNLKLLPRPLRSVLRRTLTQMLPAKTEERSLSGRLQRLAAALDTDGLERYLGLISRFPTATKNLVFGDPLRATLENTDSTRHLGVHARLDPQQAAIDAIMEVDLKTYLPDDILVKVDRASMAHSLEVRAPFLDPSVVAFACRLPYSFKQRLQTRKRILADAFGDLLPGEIFTRPKMGFGVPVAAWLRGDWQQPARELLLDGWFTREGWFERSRLELLWRDHVEKRADYSYPIFALMVLELWAQQVHLGYPRP